MFVAALMELKGRKILVLMAWHALQMIQLLTVSHKYDGTTERLMIFSEVKYLPSRKLTYPTMEKENHLQKCRLAGDMLAPWRVLSFSKHPCAFL